MPASAFRWSLYPQLVTDLPAGVLRGRALSGRWTAVAVLLIACSPSGVASATQAPPEEEQIVGCRGSGSGWKIVYWTGKAGADELEAVRKQWEEFGRSRSSPGFDLASCQFVSSEAEAIEIAQSWADRINRSYFSKGVTDRHYTTKRLDWSPQSAERDPETGDAGDLRTLKAWYRDGSSDDPVGGYMGASVDVRYTFLACMGDVHVAYSLDPASVRISQQSWYINQSGENVEPSDAPLPQPSSVHLTAKVEHGPSGIGWQGIDYLRDEFAGPSLGFGCFSGQTQKVGTVAGLAGPKATREQIEQLLNEELRLVEGRIPHTLKNASLERSELERQRQQVQEALTVRENEWKRLKAESDAAIAASRAAKEKWEQDVAVADAAAEQYRRDKAAHEAEVVRAKAAEEEYQRRLAEWRRQVEGE